MQKEIQRTHDKSIYLDENRYDSPKEITKKITSLILERYKFKGSDVIADLGCAAGEFSYHLKKMAPKGTKCLGYDLLPELISKAKEVVPGVDFYVGSVLDRNLAQENSFDVSLLQGVHSIFDDFETSFSNLIHWTRKDGMIFVFGPFNKHPVDVWVKYRLSDDPNHNHLEPGWNMFSEKSVSKFLEKQTKVKGFRFIPFEMPFDLKQNPTDPVRSWTEQLNNQKRVFTNGLSLLINLQILEIQL